MGRKRALSKAQLARKSNSRELKKKIYLYSEGKVTEVRYFRDTLRNNRYYTLEVKLTGQSPASLSAAAKSFKQKMKDTDQGDLVWIVFDRDDHPHIDRELKNLREQSIPIGYSNPCFEVWLMYHFVDHNSPDNRETVKKKLAKLHSGYCPKKHVLIDLTGLADLVPIAMKRARAGTKARSEEGAPLGAPCSTVDTLFESLKS